MATGLRALALDQCGVFTARQAFTCGIEPAELRALTRTGELVVIRRSVYSHGDDIPAAPRERHKLDVAAALLVKSGTVAHSGPDPRLAVGRRSAAYLLGLPAPIPMTLPERASGRSSRQLRRQERVVHLVSGTRVQRTYRGGIEVSPAELLSVDVDHSLGFPSTSLARTAIDIARESDWYHAVAVVDGAMHAGVSQFELNATLERCAGWAGTRQARRAVAFGSPLAESPLESRTRALLAEYGLPEPELQVDLFDARGFIGRVDIMLRQFRTVLEPDGRVKYTDPRVLWAEKVREDRIRDAGWEVVRPTWADVTERPVELIGRIRAAFVRAQRRAA
ncbi:MAG: type IV toxin-antitoxin system AbiEi family antitoxin domain-containing protein [Sporichthyaceae bacterium]